MAQKIEAGMTVEYWNGKKCILAVVRYVDEFNSESKIVVNGRTRIVDNHRLTPKLPICLRNKLEICNKRQIQALKYNATTLGYQERQQKRERKNLLKKEIEEAQLSLSLVRRGI